MIDFKKIKDSEYMPSGIRKIQDGGLFIDVDKIKSFFPDINCVRIEYFDGTRITWWPPFEAEKEEENTPLVITEDTKKMIDHLQLLDPANINEKFLKEYGNKNWMEEDLKLLEKDKEQNPSLYDLSKLNNENT